MLAVQPTAGEPVAGWGTWLLQQAIAFFGCIVVPGMVTAIAPVSWVHLTRVEDRVTAEAKTCLLFLIPYQQQTLHGVTGVEKRIHQAQAAKRRIGERREPEHRPDAEGTLILQGNREELRISVSPASISSTVERVTKFLAEPDEKNLNLFVVSNWKFGMIAGGLVSLLTVLYLAGLTIGILKGFQRIVMLPPASDVEDRPEN